MGVVEVVQRRGEGLSECEVQGPGGGRVTYRCSPPPVLPKPGFHPIVTPAGSVVTGWEPSDHVWHRGLWFTFKYVNGENFWEEHPPFGVQRPSPGSPGLSVRFEAGGGVRLEHELSWCGQAAGELLRETRAWVYRPAEGGLSIDLLTRLTAVRDVTLDRTPYTTWGGYGGLSLRASREMHEVDFVTPAGAVDASPGLTGQPHRWLALRGRMDGGRDRRVTMLMADHPSNVRHPSPWYAKSRDGFTFWNAALLFHEPLSLREGATLTLKYRVWIMDGRQDDPARWSALAETFCAEA